MPMGIVFAEKLVFRWGLEPNGLAIVIAKTNVETARRLSLIVLAFQAERHEGEVAKWIAGDSLPSYAANFSVKRYDKMGSEKKLNAVNKSILWNDVW